MRPTDELRDEHAAIRLLLLVIDRICDRLELGHSVNPDDLDAVVGFIREYGDRSHHAKEEQLLFPAMEAAGIPGAGGPVGVMQQEHAIGRQFVGRMEQEARRYRDGAPDAGVEFARSARNYIGLLTMHIEKEDQILYPMADEALPPEKQDELAAGFRKLQEETTSNGQLQQLRDTLEALRDRYLA